jgi:raffinose/stachyose/melibiose transport system substrate-binding protein
MELKKRLGALAALALLAGCAGPATGTADPSVAAPTSAAASGDASAALAPGEVKLWAWTWTEDQTALVDKAIADFEALHPGVTVDVQQRAIDAHKEALRSSLGTDASPDLYLMWAGYGLGGEFVAAGNSQDLTKSYQQYGWDGRFTDPSLSAATQYGGYNGVPFNLHGQMIYYRKADFEKAGISAPPTTYDELVAASEKLVAAGLIPMEFGGTVNWHLMRLLDNILETKCGADTHDQLNLLKASWATTPCVADAFTAFADYSKKYINSDWAGIDWNEAAQLFYTGKASMALEGDWFISNITSDGAGNPDDFGVFPFPSGTDRLYSFAEMFYVAPTSKVQDQAAAFLDYYTSKDVQSQIVGSFASTSVTDGVSLAEPTSLDTAVVDLFSGSKGAFTNSDQAFSLNTTTEYWRIQNLVASGKLDPAQAGAEFQKYIDAHPGG